MENKKMINYQYEKEAFSTFKNGIRREWALTNGIGGYAGSSLIGAHNRTHQGYLIASLHPPIERYLVFSKINESLSVFAAESTGSSDEKFHPITDTLKKGSVPAVSAVYNLETSQHKKNGETCYTQGQEYLVSFSYDGSVHYTYQAGDITLKKHICLKHGANVCAIAYEIENNGPDASLTLVPLFNFREHSASSRPEDFHFRTSLIDNSLCLIPESHPDTAILFQTSEGIFSDHTPMFDIDMQLQTEVDLETDGLDCHYCPHEVTVFLPAKSHKQISVLCSVIAADETFTDITADTAFDILKEREKYTKSLYETAGIHDDFAPRQSAVRSGSADFETTRRVDVVLGVLVQQLGGDGGLDDLLHHVGAQLVHADGLAVLAGDDHSVHAGGLAVHILHRDLTLAVRAQVVQLAALAHLGQLLGQLVGQADGHGHQLRGLIAGIAEHHALIACTAHLIVGAQCDVGALAVDVGDDGTGVGVEAELCTGIADVRHDLADDLLKIDVAVGGDLAHDVDEAGGCTGLAGHAGVGVVGQDLVQDRVGDLVADLVGMSFGNGLRSKQMSCHKSCPP